MMLETTDGLRPATRRCRLPHHYTRRVSTRLAAAFLVLVGIATACRPDTVELVYRFEPGREFRYTLTARGRVDYQFTTTTGSGDYLAVFDVTETVESVEDDDAVVSVSMTPVRSEENGLQSPAGEELSFRSRIGPNGEVLEVLELNGVPAAELGPEQIALIGTMRPKLPLEAETIGATWDAGQEFPLPSTFSEVTTRGELEGLAVDSEGRVAEIGFSGGGPLSGTITIAGGNAELTGALEVRGDAVLDVDGGFLRSATTRNAGDFQARLVPLNEAPLSGAIHLELDIDLELKS
jgi:hypothetical protein